jgi:hypothetical protein
MEICVIEDCTDIGHCFGGLCKRHYSYRMEDDPSFNPELEPAEVKAVRERAWFAYCRAEAAHKSRRTVEALSLALLHDAPLIGRAIWHSRRLDSRYPEGDERKPLYRTLLQMTHTLGEQIYGLQDAGAELLRPLHGVHSPYLDSFRSITQTLGWRRGASGVPVSGCKWIQRMVKHLRLLNAFPREQLLAIGRTAYKLATLTRAFERLCNEIGMRAVHAIILRGLATTVLPSAALRAFGADHENVHTPVATGPTEQALAVIAAWAPLSVDLWPRLVLTLGIDTEEVWDELEWDVKRCVSFGHTYGPILERIVAKIDTKEEEIQRELFRRLTEEIVEGFGLCVQGKMTRLANVLRGFDPEIDACVSPIPSREQFQNRIVVIRKSGLPLGMQKDLATQLMEECLVPKEEHEAWLAALEE